MVEKLSTAEVLREELMKLVREGDTKKEGALTPAVLLRIMRVAKTGRDLLVSLNVKDSNLAGMVRRPRFGGPLSIGENYGDEDLEDVGGAMAVPFAPAMPQENFGMTAMREMIAIAKNFNGPSPAKLVEALAVAKENGLDDVAKQLEEQLKEMTAKQPQGVADPAKGTPPPVAPILPPSVNPA